MTRIRRCIQVLGKKGLYRSIDHGKTWHKLTSNPSPDIRSIKIGNHNPSLVYAATSSFGVMKSIDGGDTWKRNDPQLIDSTFKFAWSIEIDRDNDNIIYAQTFNRGVWKSTNQGDTWQQVLDIENKVCWDMKVTERTLWVAYSKSRDSISSIHYSEDVGESWKEMDNVPQIGISQINALEKDGKTLVYIGSWSDGIYVLEEERWTKVEVIDYDVISEILINH